MSRYNMKIEVKDSIVTATMYDEYGEYVSEVTCNDSDLYSVIRATKKAIIHAGEYMKSSWPNTMTCITNGKPMGCPATFGRTAKM